MTFQVTLTMSPTYTDRCWDGTFANKAKGSGGQHSVENIILRDINKLAKHIYIRQYVNRFFLQFFQRAFLMSPWKKYSVSSEDVFKIT